ncbi:MAG: VWA domain-containing protein [Moritella sp.]|uniref:vWA domain-containing protein n=1 Tax=Moritella sp. TaxID=78556 RepID=UPI001D562579|nr:VWA domain-containing protein [Moritella sp.]NQZ49660.1 VWA domain-containing protein [Moritella sp.]
MTSSILNAMPIVASTYADQMGVNIVVSNQASTDGKTINTVLDETNLAASWGYLCHEAAHIKHSDFTIAGDLQFRHEVIGEKLANHPLFFSLVNMLEDSRIEFLFMQEYPGMNRTFNAMNQQLIDKGLWSVDVNADAPNAVMQLLILYPAGQMAGLNYSSCTELSKQSFQTLTDVIGITHAKWVANIAMSSIKAKNHRECAALAAKVLQYMLDNTPQPDKANKPSDKQQSDSQSGDQQGNSQGGDQQGNSQPICNDTTFVDFTDKGQLTAAILNASENKDGISKNVVMASTLLKAKPLTRGGIVPNFNFDEEKAKLILMGNKVRSFIKARSQDKRLPSRTGRNLNGRKIAKIMQGCKRPFIRNIIGDSTSTGVYISLDISGSMNRKSRIEIARTATVGIAHVINSIKDANVSVSAFNDEVKVIKSFSEQLQSRKGAFGVKAGGNTNMMPALLHGVKELSNCKKSRKMMIIITDGKTSDSKNAASTISAIKASGVDVHCVGIQMSGRRSVLDQLFTSSGWVNINSADELNKALFNIVKQSL